MPLTIISGRPTSRFPARLLAALLALVLALAVALIAGALPAGAAAVTGTPIATAPAATEGPIKTFLQVGAAPVDVNIATPGEAHEVLFTGGAGQSVTIDLQASGFADPCDVKVDLSTPAGAALVTPTCAGDGTGTLLPTVTVTATALLHLNVVPAAGASGHLSVQVTGTGTASLTPNAPAATIMAPAATRTVLVLPAQLGDTIGVDVRASDPDTALFGLGGELVRGQTHVDYRHAAGRDRLAWAYTSGDDSELRLWLTNHSDHDLNLSVILTSAGPATTLPLPPGLAQTVGLRRVGATTNFTFTPSLGSRPVIELHAADSTDDSYQGTLTLIDPTGQVRNSSYIRKNDRQWNAEEIDVAGTWTLVVESGLATGRLTFTLRAGSTDPTSVVLGEPTTITFDHPGQVEDLLVTPQRGDTLTVEVSGFAVVTGDVDNPAVVSLSSGQANRDSLTPWGTFSTDQVIDAPSASPGSDQQRLRFTTSADALGSFSVTVTRTPQARTPLTAGSTYHVRFNTDNPSTVFSFPIAAGQLPVMTVSNLNAKYPVPGSPYPGYITATGGLSTDTHGASFGARSDDGVLRPQIEVGASGTYLLRVYGQYGSTGTADITVSLRTPASVTMTPGFTDTIDLASGAIPPLYRVNLTQGDQPYIYTSAYRQVAFVLVDTVTGRQEASYATGLGQLFGHRVTRTGSYLMRVSGTEKVTFRFDQVTSHSNGTLTDGGQLTLTTHGAYHYETAEIPNLPGNTPVVTVSKVDTSRLNYLSAIDLRDARGAAVGTSLTWAADGKSFQLAASQVTHPGPLTVRWWTRDDVSSSAQVQLAYRQPVVRSLSSGQQLRLPVDTPYTEVRLAFTATAGQSLTFYTDTFRWLYNHRLADPASVVLIRPNGTDAMAYLRLLPKYTSTPFVLDATGRWTLRITPGHATGLIKITPYLGTSHSSVLTSGADVTVPFAVPGEPSFLTLNFAAGQHISVAPVSAALSSSPPADAKFDPAPAVQVTLTTQDGQGYYSDDTLLADQLNMLVGGDLYFTADTTLVLKLVPRGVTTGSLKIHAYDWAEGSGIVPLSIGTTVHSGLSVPGRPAIFTVDGAKGDRVGLRISAATLSAPTPAGALVTATGPSGDEEYEYRFTVPATGEAFNDLTLPAAGTWRFSVLGDQATTGSFDVTRTQPRDLSSTLSGTSGSLTLDQPGDRMKVKVSTPAGQTGVVTVARVSGSAPAERGSTISATSAAGDVTCSQLNPALDRCELTQPGGAASPITVTIDPQLGDTGVYSVTSTAVTDQQVTWTPGTALTLSVPAGSSGQDIDITLPQTKNTRVALAVSADSFTSSQAPVDPGSWPQPPPLTRLQYLDSTGWHDDTSVEGVGITRSSLVWADNGARTIRLQVNGDGHGSLTATVYLVKDLTGRAFQGTPLNLTFDQPGTWAVYRLHLFAGYVKVHVTGSTIGPYQVCWTYAGCSPVLADGDSDVVLPTYVRQQHQGDLQVIPLSVTGSGHLTIEIP